MDKITLSGITWGHSRGYTPLMALSQRFSELHPHVDITWQKRTLQEFADLPLENMTSRFDLLIIDHPWVGCAAASHAVIALDEYLPKSFLDDQSTHSVGSSYLSYEYDEHQWALPIDAAAPVASYRSDLIEKHDTEVPRTWKELIRMAEEKRVAIPGAPVDLLMYFYMFCLAHGETPFQSGEKVIDRNTGMQALDSMRELWSLVDEHLLGSNPICIAELMSTSDDYWYCPFAYGYSNYSRKGYARNILQYSDLVSFGSSGKLRSTLGGTGLSISASCKHKKCALEFAQWALSPEIQSTLYVEHGGQPGHRTAWMDSKVNEHCSGFFINTLQALDRAYLRPRYNGYLQFQDEAGVLVHEYLKGAATGAQVLEKMNAIYLKSQNQKHSFTNHC